MPSVFELLKPDQRRKLLEFKSMLKDMESSNTPIAKLRGVIKDGEGAGAAISAEGTLTSDTVHTDTYGGTKRKKKITKDGKEFLVLGVFDSKDELNVGDVVTLNEEDFS